MASTEENSLVKLIEESIKTPYYGLSYGYFTWVRGKIDIYDIDDINYIKICLNKIKIRLQKEQKDKKKNAN